MLILVLNSGSSSLKFQLFDMADESVLARGTADRIGARGGVDAIIDYRPTNREATKTPMTLPDHAAALARVAEMLTDPDQGVIASLDAIGAIGHRVVHGGERFSSAALVTPEVAGAIEACAQLAPLHNPPNLVGIRACQKLMPGTPQVAVFDTAFHQRMPRHAYLYAVPYEWYEEYGVRRYGFHGTSHKYVSERAAQWMAREGQIPETLRLITCHLGNGCSMSAVRGGVSLDTSMGFTPAEGLVMGTRSGDIDPAIVPYIGERTGMTADQVMNALNKKSGLLAMSGYSNDMRDIHARIAEGDARARLALEVFCYRVLKYAGAYAAAMGGVDAIVFTGGIGEHDPYVRECVCTGLSFLGLRFDPERNAERSGEREISAPGSSVRALVIPTNEELVIARETAEVVGARQA
ncbi:MAG TPA: acetate kinase [Armatimonadetes bacterium]|nr:acetate kinase [Armatimonadota bacterium]